MSYDDVEILDHHLLCDLYDGVCEDCPLDGNCPIQHDCSGDEDE